MASNTAEVHFTREGPIPVVELIIPHGTKLVDILKLQELISREINPKISPRGCQTCLSGLDFRIRERLENVIRIDLDSLQMVG